MRLKPFSARHIVVALAAVLVLAGSAVGIAAAQAQQTPAGQAQSTYAKFIAALAQHLNIPQATLETAVSQARQDAGLPATGQGFPGHRGPRGGERGVDLSTAATAIGITPQELRTELAGKSLADVAKAHNKDVTTVATALKDAAHKRIDAAVTAGKLTADQANTMKTQIDQRIDQLMTQVMPQGGAGKGFGFAGGHGAFGAGLDAAANAIGIPVDQLRQELPGKSLADVAKAHNKDVTTVATALKDAAHKRIDASVTAGKLTADQANTMKTQVDQKIDQFMTQVMPQGGPGFRRGPGTGGEQTGTDAEQNGTGGETADTGA